jgi:hypothetical protein
MDFPYLIGADGSTWERMPLTVEDRLELELQHTGSAVVADVFE